MSRTAQILLYEFTRPETRMEPPTPKQRKTAIVTHEQRRKGATLSLISRENRSALTTAQSQTQGPLLLGLAAAVALLHILTNGRYGFHRDELQFLSDARHLDWGFVAYPPLTPFLEHIGLALFGVSMVGLRLFSVLAQSAAIVVTGLMAPGPGGGRPAPNT